MIAVIQLKRGLAREEPTFMAIPLIEDVTTEETIPSEIKDVLDNYAGIMPESLYKHYHLVEASITKLNFSSELKPPA